MAGFEVITEAGGLSLLEAVVRNVACSSRSMASSPAAQDGDEATIRLHEKGDKRRTIGLHFQAAQAIAEYMEKAELTSGPLFRPRLNPRSKKLSSFCCTFRR